MTIADDSSSGFRKSIDAQRTRRALVSSFAGVLQRLLQVGGTLLIMPLVLHATGRESFGIWAAAASFLWMVVVVDFGIGQALISRIARDLARGDTEEARRDVGAAAFLSLLLAGCGLVLALLVIPIAASPQTRDAYFIAGICVAINIPLSLAGNIWNGLQRFHMTAFWEALQTVLTLSGLFALTHFTIDARWYVLVTAGGLLLANIGSMTSLFVCHSWLLPPLRAPAASRVKTLLRSGAPFLVLSVAAMLSINLDSVIALALLGPDAAARMAVANRACLSAYGLLWVVTQPLWPAFADAATRGDHGWVRRHIFGAAGVVALFACGGSLVLLLIGKRLVEIWMGGEMQIGGDVLAAMAAWIIVLCMGRVIDVLLNGLGAVWFQARVAIVFSALAFVLKLAFASSFGVAGVIAATAAAYCLTTAPAYLWWASRWLRDSAPARAAPVAG